MAKMKEIFTALQEAQLALKQNQLFPPDDWEVAHTQKAISALLNSVHKKGGITPHEDQESLF